MLRHTCYSFGNYFIILQRGWLVFRNTLRVTEAVYSTHQKKKKCVQILKRACKTKWLSFEASVAAAMKDLIPLVQTLSGLSESDAAAYRLLKKCILPIL